jgi:Mg2+/Co2+ transporter CorC
LNEQSLQDIVKQFLDDHKIVEAIQDNSRVIVLNHELTLNQVIDAMIVEQNAIFALIWNSEQREFTGIVTLRNILEMITYLCESYD